MIHDQFVCLVDLQSKISYNSYTDTSETSSKKKNIVLILYRFATSVALTHLVTYLIVLLQILRLCFPLRFRVLIFSRQMH